MNDTNTANAYLKTRVMTASPEVLRMMLLEGAVRFANMAKFGMENNDYEKIYEGFNQARQIVLELINTIDFTPAPELAKQVRDIYVFIFGELAKASLNKDMERLDSAIKLLEYECETWSKLLEQLVEDRKAGIVPAPASQQDAVPSAPAGLSSLSSLSIQA